MENHEEIAQSLLKQPSTALRAYRSQMKIMRCEARA